LGLSHSPLRVSTVANSAACRSLLKAISAIDDRLKVVEPIANCAVKSGADCTLCDAGWDLAYGACAVATPITDCLTQSDTTCSVCDTGHTLISNACPVTANAAGIAADIAASSIAIKSSIKFSFEAKEGLVDLSGTHTLTYEDAAYPAVSTTTGSTTALSFTQASAPGAPQCLDVRPAIPWVRLRMR
jgi:hypothetical protein